MTVVLADWPESEARSSVFPGESAETRPCVPAALETDATAESTTLQTTSLVTSWMLPSE